MDEYIEREAAEKVAEKYGCTNGSALGIHSGLADCIAFEIAKLPAADVAPVRHGVWVREIERTGNYSHCSECGCRCAGYTPNYKYCPNCGAKMDLEG